MMKVEKSELVIFLESIDDQNELAWWIIAEGVYYDRDPDIVALVRRATIGSGEHSTRLSALMPPSKRAPSRAKRSWRYERIRKHHPALEKLTTEWKKSASETTLPAADTTGESLDVMPKVVRKPSSRMVPSIAIPDEYPEPSEWDKDFLKGLKVHLYEKRFELWPHRIGAGKTAAGLYSAGWARLLQPVRTNG
jgi:hypothetical protein